MCYARHIVAVSDVGKSTSACNMVFIIITVAYLKFFFAATKTDRFARSA